VFFLHKNDHALLKWLLTATIEKKYKDLLSRLKADACRIYSFTSSVPGSYKKEQSSFSVDVDTLPMLSGLSAGSDTAVHCSWYTRKRMLDLWPEHVA